MKRIRFAAAGIAGGLILGAALAGASAPVRPAAGAPLLADMFADHAVLQRDRAVPLWGEAAPGESLTVSFAGKTLTAKADAAGHWRAVLPAMAAGGPYTLKVATQSGRSLQIGDVLIGDVYLCSGQSNMALTVMRTLDSAMEIPGAQDGSIRMLNVPVSSAAAPQLRFSRAVSWEPASPQTVGHFSAACYYFAREVKKTEHVPMGLINASSGGSNIRSWLPASALRRLGGYDEALATEALYAADAKKGIRRWTKTWRRWWARHDAGQPWKAAYDDSAWATAPKGLGKWDEWTGVPAVAGFTGQLWYRTSVTLTKAEAAKAAGLSLGNLNEEDITWINGAPVGASFGYGAERHYAVPKGVLHAGVNSIAVVALCTYRGCGLYGPEKNRALIFADGSAHPVAGPWRYRVVPKSYGPTPRAPWGAVAGLGTAYNAMQAPVGEYALKGALWYQGESNTGEPQSYGPMLAALISGWRQTFGAKLPVLVVQLPGFGAPALHPMESGTARLREAQREVAAADPLTALAVTIDVGVRDVIHPANKQAVGRRLARAARHLIFGAAEPPSGPEAISAVRTGDTVTVRFAGVTGALRTYSADRPIGFELCGKAAGSCRFAEALADGNEVRIAVPAGMHPARVRYAWADYPVVNLFDDAALPAGPFEQPVTGE